MKSSPLIEKSPTNALERNSQEMKDLRLGAEHAEDAGELNGLNSFALPSWYSLRLRSGFDFGSHFRASA